MDTIFVQIASYRDPQLLPTLRDCIAKATRPDLLRFGVCWQRDESDSLEELAADRRLRVVDVDYRASRGACWARHQTQQLYDGEDFTLQLDSHHRFVEGWDTALIAMLRATGSRKPILTAYAPSFDPFDAGSFVQSPWALGFDRFIPEGAVFFKPRVINDWTALTRPLPGRFFSAHFAFTLGGFCREVPYDPNYYFHGEEISMTARAFTHGYDLFCPHRVIVWHEYTRKYRTKHWEDHVAEGGAAVPWMVRNTESHRRNRILFGMEAGEIDFGPYGFGRVRTLVDYERYAGLNFRLRVVQPYTLRNDPPPNPDMYATDEEWIAGGVKDFWVRISMPPDAVDGEADYDFWYVGVHDRAEGEVDRQDLGPEQIALVLAQPEPHFVHRYRGAQKACSWTVWPHSRSRGWLQKITGPIRP
jgi:hypothetical protein